MKKYQLMAPGPTPVPSEVLLAMAQPIIHHRTPEYEALVPARCAAGLKRLFQTTQEVSRSRARAPAPWRRRSSTRCRPATRVSCSAPASSASAGRRSAAPTASRSSAVAAPFGETVPRRARRRGAAPAPAACGRAHAAERDLDRRAPRRAGRRRGHARHRRHPRGRRGVEPRASPISRWTRGAWTWWCPGSQKGLMLPPGLGVLRAQREGVGPRRRPRRLPKYYFDFAAERKPLAQERGALHARPCPSCSGCARSSGCSRPRGCANVFRRHDRLARATRAGVGGARARAVRAGHAEPGPHRGGGAAGRGQRADRRRVLAARTTSRSRAARAR